MGKKDKSKKKPNPKREKYAKFRKEKSGTMDLTMPDLDDSQQKQKLEDEQKINRFLRFNRNPPAKSIRDKKLKKK